MTLTLVPEKTGVWSLHEILTHDQVNKIASELVKAVDGVGGGTYTLSIADLQFTGSATFILALAMQLTAGHNFAVDGHINLSATGQVNVASSGLVNLASGAAINAAAGAAIALAAGASLTLATTSTIASTLGAQLTGSINLAGEIVVKNAGLLTLENGAILNVQSQSGSGGIVLARTEDLKIFGESTAVRFLMTPQWIENAAWVQQTSREGTWVQADVSAAYAFRCALNVRPGDVLVSLFANLNGAGGSGGGHVAKPSTMPQLTIFSVNAGGTPNVEAQTSDTAASQAAYDVDHLVSLTHGTETAGLMPITIAGSKAYYLDVRGEASSNSVAAALQLNSLTGVVTANSVRPGAEYA